MTEKQDAEVPNPEPEPEPEPNQALKKMSELKHHVRQHRDHGTLHLMPPMTVIPYITHSDETRVQAIGLGTYMSRGGQCEYAVKDAIDLGYRHIDSAFFNENEKEVGRAIRDKIREGVVKREDIFLTTKLWSNLHDPDLVEHACRKSLTNFGLDYVDLYLMHWPYAYAHRGDEVFFPTNADGEIQFSEIDYIDTWKAMEKLIKLGLTKSIGVCNFNSEQLARLMLKSKIKPIHNQIECHPGLMQKKLVDVCKRYKIVVSAYCPLGRSDPERKLPAYLYNAKVIKIAEKNGKTPAQVVLRFLYENDMIPLPKLLDRTLLRDCIDIFNFNLTLEDHEVFRQFDTGERIIPMEHARRHKYYPFNIEY